VVEKGINVFLRIGESFSGEGDGKWGRILGDDSLSGTVPGRVPRRVPGRAPGKANVQDDRLLEGRLGGKSMKI
jgi:hypothetical protein